MARWVVANLIAVASFAEHSGVSLPDPYDSLVDQAEPVVEDGEDGGAVRLLAGINVINGFHGQHGGEVDEDVVLAVRGVLALAQDRLSGRQVASGCELLTI